MGAFDSQQDRAAIEAEMPWEARDIAPTLHALLARTAARHPDRPAVSFQLTSGPADPAETLTWAEFRQQVTRAANLFRSLGVGPDETVAYILPNSVETAVTLVAGAVAGIVAPINPMLETAQIAAILRETGAKVVVTLRAFPRTDIAAKVAAAVAEAPGVTTVLEVDLNRYLRPPKRWLVPLLRPRHAVRHTAVVMPFDRACATRPGDALTFEDAPGDRLSALFHTGGTTGMPKLTRHRLSGMLYNGWLGARLLFRETDVLMCPLPLFHVFAAYPVMLSALTCGAHVVLPTPAGFRGDGVFDNFWKLVERWRASFMVTVPTATAALMQRKVDADVSSLRMAFSGSAPMAQELCNRFTAATGLEVVEGYGLTEATCLVSVNPPEGTKKLGSVGLAFPYTDIRILHLDAEGRVTRTCGTDEVGEICVANPGTWPGGTYTDAAKNRHLHAGGTHLRTGDLGRLDAEGYLFITGRAKDLIIRGGHNIDPSIIEEALMGHPAVAGVGAIGQPDAFAGELPCAYVELVAGATATPEELLAHAREKISERAAIPKYIEVLPELPKTAVGKVFKPDLRKRAIARVYDAALAAAGLDVRVREVVDDPKLGLLARLAPRQPEEAATARALADFTRPWAWAEGDTP